MKGIVLEELKDKLIVLTDEGDFIEIDKLIRQVEIGEKIIIEREKTNTKQTFRRFAFAAAVFFMMILGNYAVYGSFVTQGYVSIGINPSDNKNIGIEIAYNSFQKAIKLKALNEVGNALIEKMDRFKFKPTSVVINEFIKAAEKEGVISQEENTIVITIATFKKKIDDESLYSSVEHYIKDNKIKAKVKIVLGNKTDYENSKESGVPIDKYILINEAIKKNPAYKFDDLNKKSVEEIIHIINQEEKNYE